jgi:hypothetical protein
MNSRDYCSLFEKYIDTWSSEWINNICIIGANSNININLCKKLINCYSKCNEDLTWSFWNCVSHNINGISLEDIEKNPGIPWNYYYVSTRKDMTIEFAIRNSKLLGDNINYVYSRIGTIDDLYSIKTCYWIMIALSENPNITKEFVEKYSCLIWDWGKLLFLNTSIRPYYKYFIEKYNGIKFNKNELIVSNANIIPFDIIKDYYDEIKSKPNFFLNFSHNKTIPIDFIKSHIDDPWDWCSLSSNPAVTKKFIDEFIDKPWIFSNLSDNPNIDLELVKKHLDKPWVWENISKHINITFRDIYENLDLPWTPKVFHNPNIKFKHLEKLSFLRGEYYYRYIYNPNLTLEDIESIQHLNFSVFGLLFNEFRYDKRLRIIAKRTIIKYYRKYKLMYKLKHLAKQSRVVDELKYKPMLGIKYYETMEEISSILENTTKDSSIDLNELELTIDKY